ERDFATRCFSQIEGFGTYGFPESHAASFALLVYVSSWIKCFFPEVFACALLNSQPMGFYAPAQIVRDAPEHGVDVRPVAINHSFWDCTLEPVRDRMDQRRASFETAATRPSQGEEFLNAINGSPHAEERRQDASRSAHDAGAARDSRGWALRLGLRQIKGFA